MSEPTTLQPDRLAAIERLSINLIKTIELFNNTDTQISGVELATCFAVTMSTYTDKNKEEKKSD
jgi:hypothetical protein